MARALFKLAAVSRAIGVLGVSDSNLGNSNVFQCELRRKGVDAPVIFDSSLNAPLSSVSTDIAKFYFEKLTSTNAIPAETTMDFSRLGSFADECVLSDSSIVVPVTVIDLPGLSIAVVSTGPKSTFFSTHAVLSTNRLQGKNEIDMMISDKADAVDDRNGCLSNNADRMVMQMSSETDWEFGVESIGLLTNKEAFVLLSDSTPKAIVASASEGLGFPETVFEGFKANLESAGLKLVTGSDGTTLVDDCHSDAKGLSKSLPALVLTFSGQKGYGVRINPSDYVETLSDGKCRLKIHRGSSNLVLGDSFIKSGYVELNVGQKIVMACPNEQYHLTDKHFDNSVPFADRPAPRDAPVTEAPSNNILPVDEERDKDTNNQALIIGLTVSGVVVIIGAIVFFVVRKRRADKLKQIASLSEPSRQRFDPSRSMIHDPSEVSSSVEEGVGTVVRV